MWLIVGLGNPGAEYAQTRHNMGFQCVDELARRHNLQFRGKRAKAHIAEGSIAGQRVAIAKPLTFMNASGQAVVGLCQWYKIAPEHELVVIYDDLDLPFGVLRLRSRGSAGTHNGMRSIVSLLGTQEFGRLRIGIGKAPPNWDTISYVLGRFTSEEQARLSEIRAQATDALEMVLRAGFTAAMNRYNAPEAKQPKETVAQSQTE